MTTDPNQRRMEELRESILADLIRSGMTREQAETHLTWLLENTTVEVMPHDRG